MTGSPRAPADSEVGIDRKVAFLRAAASYPEPVSRVDVVETHMSWVFLTDEYVYKLKKPVRQAYLDFSTLDARRQDCDDEVRLNRRLAPDVYLGRVGLTCDGSETLALDGTERVVDWLVKMRRLPREEMLDRRIAGRRVTAGDVRALVTLLVRFYREGTPVAWAPGVYARRLGQGIADNLAGILDPRYAQPATLVHAIADAQRRFLTRAADRFEQRVRDGHVVEGHGDLRPEHICLDPGPVIIDCLEFNRDLRLLDAADELAYLALECERLGDRGLGTGILEAYRAISGDLPDEDIVSFYKSYRAGLRARIAVWHLDEPGVANPARWQASGREYLELAANYARRLD
jgi:aminoglycoside phosphotransferase family enzyme